MATKEPMPSAALAMNIAKSQGTSRIREAPQRVEILPHMPVRCRFSVCPTLCDMRHDTPFEPSPAPPMRQRKSSPEAAPR
jgi:hypothetical protein